MAIRGIQTPRLPDPPAEYSQEYMQTLVSLIEGTLSSLSGIKKLIVVDSNGRRWTITVDTSGVLGTE